MIKHHGVPFLEKKQLTLKINESNTNDIQNILGYPSTKSKFDNDVWIYIERKQTQSRLKNLGRMKIFKNWAHRHRWLSRIARSGTANGSWRLWRYHLVDKT